MWVNPNHPDPPRPYEPPEDTGLRLATLPRAMNEELRVSIGEYQGHRFLGLRVWAPTLGGAKGPVRGKGVSIRARGLRAVAAALLEAAEILDGEPPRRANSAEPGPRRGPERPPHQARPAPATSAPSRPSGDGDSFDEF